MQESSPFMIRLQYTDSTEYGQSSITPEIDLDLVVVFNDGHGYLGQIGEWQLNSLYHVPLSDGLQPFVNES
jgi:hypothetical protein